MRLPIDKKGKLLHGRIGVYDGQKQIIAAEAKTWNITERKYMELLFDYIFSAMTGNDRYELIKPHKYEVPDYGEELQ